MQQATAQPQLALTAADLVPFTYRAPLDPFRELQLPEFMMQQRVRADIVVQRNVFQPGTGAWHTHPGISFVYVLDGQIQLEEFSEKTGCTTTQVYGSGQAYFEEGFHVHRAIVLSSTPAVLLVTRFNIPPGTPITTPVPAPAC
ncbi:MAG: cupin domain-containing protein [Gemmatimonadaceae bacterium]